MAYMKGAWIMVNIEAEKIEIEKYNKQLRETEARIDVDAVLELLTEDCVYIANSAPNIQGHAAWREFYEALYKTWNTFISGSITPLGIEVSSSGDMAWSHGVFVTEYENPEGCTTTGGKCITVYRKVDGKWKTAAVCTVANG
ncbi:MAG: DUF4440 domain-containing protein [Anaerolineales bacterium]|nr:MAG: DUF4440 domain-containing protein [Anaerolineales bacterium]